MKIKNKLFFILFTILLVGCSNRTIEVIVEDKAKVKPDIYYFSVMLTKKEFLEEMPMVEGKEFTDIKELKELISKMENVEMSQNSVGVINGLGMEMETLVIRGEEALDIFFNRLKEYGNAFGHINGIDFLEEKKLKSEEDLLKKLLDRANKKGEIIASKQNINLGSSVKVEEIDIIAFPGKKKTDKPKIAKKNQPTGFEILNEKFIEYGDFPGLDKERNFVIKKKIRVIYKIEK